jgi:4-oxalocrotonate tautomerase
MPYVNVKLNVKPSDELRKKIVDRVLENTTNILNKKEDVTSVLVEFISPNSWSVGGKNVPTFYLDIKITKGTNTKEQRANYIKKCYTDFTEILGEISPVSYSVIDEVNADSWGFEGVTQEYRYIQSKTV